MGRAFRAQGEGKQRRRRNPAALRTVQRSPGWPPGHQDARQRARPCAPRLTERTHCSAAPACPIRQGAPCGGWRPGHRRAMAPPRIMDIVHRNHARPRVSRLTAARRQSVIVRRPVPLSSIQSRSGGDVRELAGGTYGPRLVTGQDGLTTRRPAARQTEQPTTSRATSSMVGIGRPFSRQLPCRDQPAEFT